MRAALLLVALLATWSSPMGYPCLVLLRKCFGATLAFRLELSLRSFPRKQGPRSLLTGLSRAGRSDLRLVAELAHDFVQEPPRRERRRPSQNASGSRARAGDGRRREPPQRARASGWPRAPVRRSSSASLNCRTKRRNR